MEKLIEKHFSLLLVVGRMVQLLLAIRPYLVFARDYQPKGSEGALVADMDQVLAELHSWMEEGKE